MGAASWAVRVDRAKRAERELAPRGEEWGACWASRVKGRERRRRTGLGSGELLGPRRSLGRGELGRAERVLGFLGAGLSIFLSYFLFFSFLNLIQTKFEFKFEFEFKPHSNKIMHQHECNKI